MGKYSHNQITDWISVTTKEWEHSHRPILYFPLFKHNYERDRSFLQRPSFLWPEQRTYWHFVKGYPYLFLCFLFLCVQFFGSLGFFTRLDYRMDKSWLVGFEEKKSNTIMALFLCYFKHELLTRMVSLDLAWCRDVE